MHEVAQFIGCISAVLLIISIAVWVKLFSGPAVQRRGGDAALKVSSVENASQLLVVAASLSAVAAFLGFVGWFAT